MQFPSTLLESPGGLPRGYSAVRGETVQSLRSLPFPWIGDRLAGFLDSLLFKNPQQLCLVGKFKTLYAREQANACYQVASIEWFYDIIISSRLKSGYFILNCGEGSKQHDRQMMMRGSAANRTTEI